MGSDSTAKRLRFGNLRRVAGDEEAGLRRLDHISEWVILGAGGLVVILATIAILIATINIAGGFLVTHRMLKMFRRDGEGDA